MPLALLEQVNLIQQGANQGLEPAAAPVRLADDEARTGSLYCKFFQCNFNRGSVPRPILLPSIINAVRKNPYSAIWCMRYSDT